MERVSDRHTPEVWSELLIEQLFLSMAAPAAVAATASVRSTTMRFCGVGCVAMRSRGIGTGCAGLSGGSAIAAGVYHCCVAGVHRRCAAWVPVPHFFLCLWIDIAPQAE